MKSYNDMKNKSEKLGTRKEKIKYMKYYTNGCLPCSAWFEVIIPTCKIYSTNINNMKNWGSSHITCFENNIFTQILVQENISEAIAE